MNYKNTSSIRYEQMKQKYNSKLLNKNQNTCIDFLDAKTIIFSNKKIFKDNDRKCWINRLRNSSVIIENFDNIINDVITIESLRKEINSIAGKLAWEISRDKILLKMEGKNPWNKGITGEKNSFFNKSHTEEAKKKISDKNKGENNGMYGKKMSDECKSLHSQKMKTLILEGKFTPNTNNRNTHWESTLDGVKYRSSWECLYKLHNPNSIYEKLRIEYIYQDKTKIYIVDFIDETNKLVIEVKPNNILKQEISKVKLKYLNEWCKDNNFNIIIVNEEWILENIKEKYIDYNRFNKPTQEKIKKFYEINKKNRN
jgi:very-short-patch-repair endonuclease